MVIPFSKYHGTGNDFILVDDRNEAVDASNDGLIRTWCERRTGIGADGLILLRGEPAAGFEMVYFNSDGYPGSMCANGARCFTCYAYRKKISGREIRFNAFDGRHEGRILGENLAEVSLQGVNSISRDGSDFVVDTGSPHFVRFVESIDSLDVVSEGRKIRNRTEFAEKGINVNFVKRGSGGIEVRTYERGVENETLSCGTGVVASAICSVIGKPNVSGINVKTLGGSLRVSFSSMAGDTFTDIWLKGPAVHVFDGELDLTL